MKKEVEEHRMEIVELSDDLIEQKEDFKKMDLSESEKNVAYEHYTKDSLELEETIKHFIKDSMELKEILEHLNKDSIKLKKLQQEMIDLS